MKIQSNPLLALGFLASMLHGQEANLATDNQGGPVQESTIEAKSPTFAGAHGAVQEQLERTLAELDALRQEIADEKVPLSRELTALESELVEVRQKFQDTARNLDGRTLDLSTLRNEIQKREDENVYLGGLLSEYIRNFEAGVHISEVQLYEDVLEAAKLAPENTNLTQDEVFLAQAALLGRSIGRLEAALGGTEFEGTAVDKTGLVKDGKFLLLGPAALFLAKDGEVGTAEQRLGSLEPTVISFATPELSEAATRLVETGAGQYPLDPTLGDAHKVTETEKTVLEEVEDGGVVMIPIGVLAGTALLVALYKWLVLSFQFRPSRRQVQALLDAVEQQDENLAKRCAGEMRGPVGRMLAVGVEHVREPRELIEEVMYETVLKTRLKLQKMLSFIAISAASAPLLGLLGTVTGIIATFKMITVFGSGDVKALSGGISEALITTKFGLIVAIPSLLIHAFLSRKARSIVGQMEQAAVAFVNQVSRSGWGRAHILVPSDGQAPAAPDQDAVEARVRAAIDELLEPMVRERLHTELAKAELAKAETS